MLIQGDIFVINNLQNCDQIGNQKIILSKTI